MPKTLYQSLLLYAKNENVAAAEVARRAIVEHLRAHGVEVEYDGVEWGGQRPGAFGRSESADDNAV